MDYKEGGWVSVEELERRVRCLMGDSEERQKVRKRTKETTEISKKAVARGGFSSSS